MKTVGHLGSPAGRILEFCQTSVMRNTMLHNNFGMTTFAVCCYNLDFIKLRASIRAYLQPSKLKFLPTEFNLKFVVELGGDVG
jgi:hypothetical protein